MISVSQRQCCCRPPTPTHSNPTTTTTHPPILSGTTQRDSVTAETKISVLCCHIFHRINLVRGGKAGGGAKQTSFVLSKTRHRLCLGFWCRCHGSSSRWPLDWVVSWRALMSVLHPHVLHAFIQYLKSYTLTFIFPPIEIFALQVDSASGKCTKLHYLFCTIVIFSAKRYEITHIRGSIATCGRVKNKLFTWNFGLWMQPWSAWCNHILNMSKNAVQRSSANKATWPYYHVGSGFIYIHFSEKNMPPERRLCLQLDILRNSCLLLVEQQERQWHICEHEDQPKERQLVSICTYIHICVYTYSGHI